MSCRMSFVAEYIVKNTPVHTNANREPIVVGEYLGTAPRTRTALAGRSYTSRKAVALEQRAHMFID
jgi:hypothetical protein